ncbi:MAG: BrnA antitoxin family protein, partial [Treponema sp.]|nr:BrnA antitoxin family protein [Treponema sp.]
MGHGRQFITQQSLDPASHVYYSDLKNSPTLSKKRIAEIKSFQNENFSDNPEWSAEDWKKARPAYTKIPKADIHTKIDADILEWLKTDGKGYQSRLNAALR